jgi:hypothetical protein
MTKMAVEDISRAALAKRKYLIKKPPAEVREENKRGVEFPENTKMQAIIQRPPAMLGEKETCGCHACQNGTAQNSQTGWRSQGSGPPPPDQRIDRTPEPTQPLPSMPATPTGNKSRAQSCQIVNLPTGYTYSHSALPSAQIFEDEEDTQHDTDFDPDMLNDESLYTFCGVVMKKTFVLKMRVAD